MHLIPIIYDMSHIYGPLERGTFLFSKGTYGMYREMVSNSEVKEAGSPVIAQSARVCRDLLKNQCSIEPMVNRCAPSVSSGDHIVSVVFAWSPSRTAWSHILVNLDTEGVNKSIFLTFRATTEGRKSLCFG